LGRRVSRVWNVSCRRVSPVWKGEEPYFLINQPCLITCKIHFSLEWNFIWSLNCLVKRLSLNHAFKWSKYLKIVGHV
jgi:hypothetical protein